MHHRQCNSKSSARFSDLAETHLGTGWGVRRPMLLEHHEAFGIRAVMIATGCQTIGPGAVTVVQRDIW
eukprot:2931125-Amphidinium_carterae.1